MSGGFPSAEVPRKGNSKNCNHCHLSAFFERRNLTLRGELPTGLDCVRSVFGLFVSFSCLFRCLFVCVPVYFSEIVVVLKKPRGHSWLGSSALK